MEPRLTAEMMEALAQPFPAEAISWKPGATAKNGSRALALAYADSRYYQDRLNEVTGADWQDDYQVLSIDGKAVVVCCLSVCGVARTDVGECDFSDSNAITTAAAQAFKRACVKFGLGAYLYRLPRLWVEYDAQRKGFTDAALARLQQAVSSGNRSQPGNGNGDLRVPAGEYAGKSLEWLLEHDRGYLAKIASGANDAALREAARALLN
jgi:hypothetical protein